MKLRSAILIIILILVATVGALYYMGRLPICECGYVSLGYPEANGPQNSQQIADPYTFTHLLHGLFFYLLLWLILPRRTPFLVRLIIAIGIESAWEVLENTQMVINHYRSVTISLGYYGDTIINSVSDIIAMALAFIFASRVKVWMSIAVFVLIEIFLLFWIKDNLTINIIMLVFPLEAIKNWQIN